MSLNQLIKSRRSVRHFDPAHKIGEADLRHLLSAGALAPSSYNMQNRHLVAILDDGVKEQLADAAFGQQHVRDASVMVVLTGSRHAYKNMDRYLRDAPAELRQIFETAIPASYAENDRLARDEDCRSIAFAAMNLMLTAVDMGLDSCPIIGFEPAKVSQVLGLPDDHEPLLLLAIGKATEKAPERLGLLNLEELVSIDKFGTHSMVGAIDA